MVVDGLLLQEHLDLEASGLVLSEVVMLCWSPWTCGLLVRTGVFWDGEDYCRTVRRAGRQVGFMDLLFSGIQLDLSPNHTTCMTELLVVQYHSKHMLFRVELADSGDSQSFLYNLANHVSHHVHAL